MTEVDGRTEHYGLFYEVHPIPADLPILLVVGNCQAESLRLLLSVPEISAVRMPPVHELTPDDMVFLDRLIAKAELVVSQPIKQDYRGLRVGTDQIAEKMGRGAQLCLIPGVRYGGLYPFQAIVRDPRDTSAAPPIVPYHDLRHLAEAAGLVENGNAPDLSVEGVRAIAESSLAELKRREALHNTIVISDVFRTPTFGHMRTINHPGNLVLSALADRVRRVLGVSTPTLGLDRELLNNVHSPREEAVITALGLAGPSEADWTVDGAKVSTDLVREAHLQWYREHPDAVGAGLERHELSLRTLGLV